MSRFHREALRQIVFFLSPGLPHSPEKVRFADLIIFPATCFFVSSGSDCKAETTRRPKKYLQQSANFFQLPPPAIFLSLNFFSLPRISLSFQRSVFPSKY